MVMKPYVIVLGTKYIIEIRSYEQDEFLAKNGLVGYCSENEKLIVLADLKDSSFNMNEIEKEHMRKVTLRHEILHSFLNESGLSDSANCFDRAWCKNEEMIDWFAIQFPKLLEAYKWCDCL